MLAKNLSPDFEPSVRLCTAFVTQIKLLDPSENVTWAKYRNELLENVIYYAQRSEVYSNNPQIGLMDDMSKLVHMHQSLFDADTYTNGFLEYLVHRRLYLYLAVRLTRKPEVSTLTKTALLHSAFSPHKSRFFPEIYDTRVISLLLEHGAKLN